MFGRGLHEKNTVAIYDVPYWSIVCVHPYSLEAPFENEAANIIYPLHYVTGCGQQAITEEVARRPLRQQFQEAGFFPEDCRWILPHYVGENEPAGTLMSWTQTSKPAAAIANTM